MSSGKRKTVESVEVPKKKRLTRDASSSDAASTHRWRTNGTSLIYKCEMRSGLCQKRIFARCGAAEKGCRRVACFDLDGTLVETKGPSPFPRSPTDWVFFNEHVPTKLRSLHGEAFRLVVFSNQGGIRSKVDGVLATRIKARIDQILKEVGVPVDVFLATTKDTFRKPEVGMWGRFLKTLEGVDDVDVAESFFVGDAAGRSGDFSDSDKIFAQSIGLPFMTPDDFFKETPAVSEEKADVAETSRAKL